MNLEPSNEEMSFHNCYLPLNSFDSNISPLCDDKDMKKVMLLIFFQFSVEEF